VGQSAVAGVADRPPVKNNTASAEVIGDAAGRRDPDIVAYVIADEKGFTKLDSMQIESLKANQLT